MIGDLEKRVKEKMKKTEETFIHDLSMLKAGRANPHMLDKITVDYYGVQTPLSQMAAVASPEARLLTVQPWDASLLKDVERAIMASDLGLNPSNDGKVIRLMIPQLTEERRRELVKIVGKTAEECKVALRHIRRSGIEELKKAEKAKEITEDDYKDGEKAIQKILDDFVNQVDEIMKNKEEEIMTV